MMAVEDLEGPVAVRYPRGEEGNYQGFSLAPVVVHSQGDDLTVICYGAMINCVLEAEELLKKQGISCDVIRLTRLDVPDMDMILNSVQKTKRLLVPEEAATAGCMGNRILAASAERGVVPRILAAVLCPKVRWMNYGLCMRWTERELLIRLYLCWIGCNRLDEIV